MRHAIHHALAAALSVALCGGIEAGAGTSPDVSVVIDCFYEAGCPDCNRVRDQVMPELRARFEGFHTLNRYDVGIKTNVLRLIAYQEKLGIRENKPVCMVVDYQYVLNGFDAIRTGLLARVEECVTSRMEPGWKAMKQRCSPRSHHASWQAPEAIQAAPESAGQAEARVRRFTLSAVLTAGLIDGINPCAISTLVFFMSLLGVSRVKGRGLLVMGVSFCLASFVTYTAIGFGLLRVLYLFDGLPMVRMGIEAVMMVLLAVFAYFSFRDAYRYRRTGDAMEVTLQLPDRVKARLHGIITSEVRSQRSEVRNHVRGALS